MNEKISLHKFYFDAQEYCRKTGQRYGQGMFNHLAEVRPDLAEKVRGTDKDPFYIERLNHPNWDRFVEFLETNWNTFPVKTESLEDAVNRSRRCTNPK